MTETSVFASDLCHNSASSDEIELSFPRADAIWEKVSTCGENFEVHHHLTCGARVVTPISCGSRWCGYCGPSWYADKLLRVEHLVRHMRWPAHVVLTIRNQPQGMLGKMIECLKRSWTRFRHWIKVSRLSGVVGIGITFNEKKCTWHAHLHLVIDSTWIDSGQLRMAWDRASRSEGINPNITRVTSPIAAAREIVSGTPKKSGHDSDLSKLREQSQEDHRILDELVAALDKKKMVWTFGACKLPKTPADAKQPCYCPRCGAKYHFAEWEKERVDKGDLHERRLGCLWADYYQGFRYYDDGDPPDESLPVQLEKQRQAQIAFR